MEAFAGNATKKLICGMELFAGNATQKLICWNGIICKKCNPKTDLLEWNYLQEMHQKIDLLNGIIFME
jgi:hypothetical protein